MENTIVETLEKIIKILEQPISVSDVISIIVSIISVFIAIFVPYKIMEKQNKIAIFEKRFQIYNEIELIYRFTESIENLKTIPGMPNPPDNVLAEANLNIWYNMNKGLSFEINIGDKDFFKYIKAVDEARHEQQKILNTSEFLFGKDLFSFIKELNDKYDAFLVVLTQNLFSKEGKNYSTTKNELITFVNNNKDYSKKFKKYLVL